MADSLTKPVYKQQTESFAKNMGLDGYGQENENKCPTSVRDQIAQDLFQELEMNYLKLGISQNTRAKHSVQISYHVLDFHDPGQYKDKSVGVVVVAGVMLAVAVWSSVVWFVTSRFGGLGHKIAEDALNVSMSMKCEQWPGQSQGKPQVPRRQKKVFRSSVHEAPYQTDARTPVENPKANPSGLLRQVIAATAYEKGSIQELVRPGDGQILCPLALSGVNALVKQPKTRIEVSERQAKTCLRPLRYNGGTCNGCTDATFESETKDVFMNARMRTAVLLSNPIDELWQYTQRLVAICVFRGLLSASGNSVRKYISSGTGAREKDANGCLKKLQRTEKAFGSWPSVAAGEDESALVWFGMLAMALALGYIIYKAIMMRKKEQTDRKLLKEYLGKFPDEPAPPGHTAPLKWDVLQAMFKRS
ncbi:hypothetical protein T4E_5471 [Trichinella pseudospiralis]|uniref:Uncharacterized protein n=1 Tax=Trichinella pseudospiralis TaxID=6337 RepID=A0A0V0Y4K9_TRIPS|nr:hypothetical protein T4E_5471 [Trichinella pseudospiralis]